MEFERPLFLYKPAVFDGFRITHVDLFRAQPEDP